MKRKTMCAGGAAALGLALILPEGAELGGLGVEIGTAAAFALLALAVWLLWLGGVLDGQKESARASDTGAGAQIPGKGMR